MEVDLFTLFKKYHDESLKKFKKELLNDFMSFFDTHNKIYNTRICGYKRTRNRGYCKRLCIDNACNYHIKYFISDKQNTEDNIENIPTIDNLVKNKKNHQVDHKNNVYNVEDNKYILEKTYIPDKLNNMELHGNIVDEQHIELNNKSIYNYYINIFKKSSLVRKNVNYNTNIDFSDELNIKLKTNIPDKIGDLELYGKVKYKSPTTIFEHKNMNNSRINKKLKKKKYLIEYKYFCKIVKDNTLEIKLNDNFNDLINYNKNKFSNKSEITKILVKIENKLRIIYSTYKNSKFKNLHFYSMCLTLSLSNDNYEDLLYAKNKILKVD